MASEKQRKFGQDKKDTLPRACKECEFLRVCHGECPKNRFVEAPDGGLALNYLCAGYKAFFKHADKAMRIMADLLRQNRPASDVMAILAGEGTRLKSKPAGPGETIPAPAAAEKSLKNVTASEPITSSPPNNASRWPWRFNKLSLLRKGGQAWQIKNLIFSF